MREELHSRVSGAVENAIKYRDSFSSFAYLWVENRREFLHQFLLYGHVLTQEEIEAAGDEGVPENPPTLKQFQQQVDNYEKVYSEVEKFEVCCYGRCHCFHRVV